MQLRTFLLTTLCIATAIATYAQNTSPYWSLAGNSGTTATSSSKLGTTTSIPLNLVTNNATRLRIATDGKVGIGTTSPQQRLHVEGTSNQAIFVSTSALGTTSGSGQIGYAKALPSAADQRLGYFLVGSRGGAQNNYQAAGMVGYAQGAWTSSSYPAYIAFETTPVGSATRAERMRIDKDGKVGIGTTTPTQKLHVVGNADISGDIYLGATRFLSRGPDASYDNTYVGSRSGAATTTAVNNSGFGAWTLYNTTSGGYNSAFGIQALSQNNGDNNTAIGALAMSQSTAASLNTAIGVLSLSNTKTSQYNTAIGVKAGAYHDNGWNNVFVGANSEVSGSGFYNVIAIGQGTICTAPSQVTMGNSATTSYRAYAYWSNISDGRFKQDVQEAVPGLSFITKLRPVTYRLKAAALDAFLNSSRPKDHELSAEAKAVMQRAIQDKETSLQTGFVAQEVEKVAIELGYNFSGVDAPANDKDVYGLRYTAFVVPLVKAVQELSVKADKVDALEKENTELKTQVSNMEQRLQKLEALLTHNNNAMSVNAYSAYLEQNTPNPSHGTTVIRYGIPDGATSARLTLTNSKGQLLKTFSINGRGTGQVNLETAALPAGVYNFSLWVGGREVDTKQLVITR